MALFSLRTAGRQHIPKKGGGLIASNHQSYLDPVLVGIGINRPVYFLAKRELFEANWLFGVLISSVNAIPLPRESGNAGVMRQAIRLLQEGKLVLVFPEGTRTSDGRIGPLTKGIGLLSSKANIPVIPTLINGAFEVWPRHHTLPARLKPIRVSYGKAVIPQANKSAETLIAEVQAELDNLSQI
ncbi:MAG: 1-acyl-sn-glycerol-3-phosphate acyltransferase [Planctomycetes bacterium]|nr:1-acyl-sn-glycerol-3-phosphate acyltransferase [Planctomycetota bacterium]